MTIDVTEVRKCFPGLQRPAIFLDNPGGTQIAQASIDRINAYLVKTNANHGGAFATSRESDGLLEEAHSASADFLNAARADEIVFGPNMTSLTFNISRSLARTWKPGDNILVTRLDHDANVSPWVMAAADRGISVTTVDFHPEDGTLDMEDLAAALEHHPRLVAVGYASNALGTINPVANIIEMAHACGALVYIDAVQYAPHGPIDVQKLGCDFLVCSSYKFFGPHAGILYGRHDLLEDLIAYKVRPAPTDPPGKFQTGTANHEGIAGILGALEYLEWVGTAYGEAYQLFYSGEFKGRRLHLKQAMAAIRDYEYTLSLAQLKVFSNITGLKTYGLTDPDRVAERVPTFSFTLKGKTPRQAAAALDREGLYVWDGNYYALGVTERLNIEQSGGMVRIGPVHYNTLDEIGRLEAALAKISRE